MRKTRRIIKRGEWYYPQYRWLYWWFYYTDNYFDMRIGFQELQKAIDFIKPTIKTPKEVVYER